MHSVGSVEFFMKFGKTGTYFDVFLQTELLYCTWMDCQVLLGGYLLSFMGLETAHRDN